MKPPVLLVHGAFCGGWSFSLFKARLEEAGYACLAPDLRGHDAGASSGDVANISMSDYANDIAALARALPEPPILVGHSMGGLVAQLAAARTPLSALVLLAPSAPWGVAGASLEEAASAFGLYALGPFWAQAVGPDKGVARLYSLDRMEPELRRLAMNQMVPESGRALFETLNWWLDPFMTTMVDVERIRCPVFVGVGSQDVIHPPATVRQTAARLRGELKVFEGMSHWLIGERGYEAVADACLAWLAEKTLEDA